VDSGTQAGDKIEIAAIANTFTDGKERPEPLVVGSVKTNIGHLEAAAGIAGLIKTVLALERGSIPPHLNFEKEREGMHLQARNIKVNTSLFHCIFRCSNDRATYECRATMSEEFANAVSFLFLDSHFQRTPMASVVHR
jgi:hypothetical protein